MQRLANRATLIALGLLLLFFLIAGFGDWEGMIGLALGLLLYFIALAHIPLGLVALYAAFRTRRPLRNLWVFGYFIAFALAAFFYIGGMNQWGKVLEETVEGVTDPSTVALRDALGIGRTNAGKAQRAIVDGAAINTRDRSDRTPLMLAANAGHLVLTRSLLERGADVGVVTRYGDTALHYAAGGGGYRHTNPSGYAVNADIVRLLLEAGAPLEIAGYKEWTPLLVACASGSITAYELIRNAGGDPGAHEKEGMSCIDIATRHAHADFVNYLLHGQVDGPEAGRALAIAVYRGHAEVFAVLLEGGAAPAGLVDRSGSLVKRLVDPRRTHRAEPHAAMYAALLASGKGRQAFPDNGYKAMRWSLGREVEALDQLLALGLDANVLGTNDATILHDMAGRVEGQRLRPHFEHLVMAGAKVDALTVNGFTPLMYAARKGNLEMAQWLITAGADVNYTNEIGHSALTEAARAGFGYVIDALAEAGVAVPPPGEHGTLLVAAREYGPGTAALLRMGLDPNTPDDRGVLPLFDAINYGDPEAVAALIEAGADLSQHDGSDQSPLTAAAARDRDAAITVLIHAGADPNAVDARRRQPLEIVTRKGAVMSTIALIKGGAVPTPEQRARIEERMLVPNSRRRGSDQLEVLRALL